MGVAHWQRLQQEAEEQLKVLQRVQARQPAPEVERESAAGMA
jgi:hypothetical protein